MKLPVYSPISEICLPMLPNHKIWVKRDDLIDPFVSGNKWRKLKYTLIKAKKEGKNHLVSFGGAFSNHLLALASVAAKFGFKSTAFVRGEMVTNPILSFCKIFGMELIFTDRLAYQDKKKLFDLYFASNKEALFIDEGGASEEGIQGCAEIVSELETCYDYIFCASGTGTTAQGLLQALCQKKLETELHVVPVLKNADEIWAKLSQISPTQFKIQTGYEFGGYAKTKPELIQFIKEFVAHTGIMIDPIYTAKVFYAVQDLILKNEIQENQKVLVLHTGGQLGLLGKLHLF